VAVSAVAGMGGVGKTELAIRYARDHEGDYPGGICWLNARESNLAAEIIQFAQLHMNLEVPQKRGESPLNLIQQVEWCWRHWQPAEGLVLVVLDDVTDLRSCRGVLPTANRFRVLMTTRLRGLDSNFVNLPLDVLSPDAALELLTGLVGERRVVGAQSFAPLLCEWLGYLPLGLELVGRYLAEDPDLSLAEMLERLKEQRLQDEAIDLDEQQLQNTFSTAQRGVRAAFELSWQELEPLTQRVAQLLSLFAPSVFLWKWVESETKLLNCSKSDINTAKKQLYKRHLIGRVEEREGGYKIHPLIREFLQAKLDASEQADEFIQAFARVMMPIARCIPQSPTVKDIESVKDAIPHLEEVVQTLTFVLSNEDLILSFVGLSRFYEGQGLYALSESWRKQCLAAVEARVGDNHPYVAQSLNNLAFLYKSQGRYSEAEPLFIRALELIKSSLGDDRPCIAQILNNLAALYTSQGCYGKAETLYNQALEMRKRLQGNDHPKVAESLNNLALLYTSQGRYSEAEPLFVEALELWRHLLGNDCSQVALGLNNLALLYYDQGRYSEAECLYKQALELRKRLLGDNHPDIAQSLNNLAALYRTQGRYSEAESLLVQALKLIKCLLGEEHPYFAASLNNLAELHQSQGHDSEAEPLFVQALELMKRLLGEEHPDVARTLNNLALLYKTQGRFTEAELLYVQALKLSRHLLGEEHPDVANSLNNLALLYFSQGHYDQAKSLFRQALALSERVLGVNHPNTITIRENLALFKQERNSHNS
jgi:tetratricopeptide (TPR) repeat protein